MAENSIIRINEISSLVDFQKINTFNITYYFEDGGAPTRDYESMAIYRYIGKLNDCTTPTKSRAQLIRTVGSSTVYQQSLQPAFTLFPYVDDLTQYNDANSVALRLLYNFNDANNDKEILHDIMWSKRRVAYFIETFKDPGFKTNTFNKSTHIINGHAGSTASRVEAVAPRTMVFNDVFHEEGDLIWSTLPQIGKRGYTQWGSVHSSIISEQGGSTHRYLQGPIHGGYLFADNMVYELGTGLQLGLDNYLNASHPYYGNIQASIGGKTFVNQEGQNSTRQGRPGYTQAPWVEYAYSWYGGTFPSILANPLSRITSYANNYNYNKLYMTADYDALNSNVLLTRTRAAVANPVTIVGDLSSSFDMSAAQDDSLWVIQAPGTVNNTVTRLEVEGHTRQTLPVYNPHASSITIDDQYAPSIYHDDNSFNIFIGKQNGTVEVQPFEIGTDSISANSLDLTFEWTSVQGGDSAPTDVRGISVDSESNAWIEWATGHMAKFYQCENSSEYPYGGYCRYPSVPLSGWQAQSPTNTPKIEWFLTRNGQNSDFSALSPVNQQAYNTLTDIRNYIGASADDDRYKTGMDTTIGVTYYWTDVPSTNIKAGINWRSTETAQSLFDKIAKNNSSNVWMTYEKYEKKHTTWHLNCYWRWVNRSGYVNWRAFAGIGDANNLGSRRCRNNWAEDGQISDSVAGGYQPLYARIYDDDANHRPLYNLFTSTSTRKFGNQIYTPDPVHTATQTARVNNIGKYIDSWIALFGSWDTAYINQDSGNFVSGVTSEAQRRALIEKNIMGCRVYPNFCIPEDGLKTDESYRSVIMNRRGAINDCLPTAFAKDVRKTPETAPANVGFDDIQPATTQPTFLLTVDPNYKPILSENLDIYPWNENDIQPIESSDAFTSGFSITGFDNLEVPITVHVEPGSFILNTATWHISNDPVASDGIANILDYTGFVNTIPNYDGNYQTAITYPYIYKDPSRSSFGEEDDRTLSGNYFISISAFMGLDAYTCSYPNIQGVESPVYTIERWPEARFYIEMGPSNANRYNWLEPSPCPLSWFPESVFTRNQLPEFTYSNPFAVGSANTNPTDNNTAFGVDPISARFIDRSIARSFPLSSWYIGISTTNVWSEEIQEWDPLTDTKWKYATSFNVADLGYVPHLTADRINKTDSGGAAVLFDRTFRYGEYTAQLDVSATHWGTYSLNSSGDYHLWTQNLEVAALEPVANFWAISAQTVDPNDISIIVDAHMPNSYNNFVSGYSPNVTVWFADSSESHTFPISEYEWNFGNPFSADPILSIYPTATAGSFDLGCWSATSFSAGTAVPPPGYEGAQVVKHSYSVPGFYKVSMTAKDTITNTQSVCSRYPADDYYVLVKELQPEAHFESSDDLVTFGTVGLTGESPYSIYTLASATELGSFPIWRMSYDWGDGGPIESYVKYPNSNFTDLGTPVTAASAFGLDVGTLDDPFDPRTMVVPHLYTNFGTDPYTYSIMMTAFSESTNSKDTAAEVLEVTVTPKTIGVVDTRHLIKSRFVNINNDVVYALDGEEINATYHYVLSGGEDV